MKKTIIILSIILSAGCVWAKNSILSESLIPSAQVIEVSEMVYAKAFKAVGSCNKGTLTEINVTSDLSNCQKNKSGKIIYGAWNEEWGVNACGVNVVVPIILKQQASEYSRRRNVIHTNSYLKYKFGQVRLK